MASVRLIPERTIDSLLTAELLRYDPHSLFWSPTNYAGSPDHILYSPNLTGFVFECKAVVGIDIEGGWHAPVGNAQLNAYCKVVGDVRYVFLAPPDSRQSPWERTCDACGGDCRQCPRDSRALSNLHQLVAGAPTELRLQPWFSHWAFVVNARDLRRHLSGSGRLALDGQISSAPGFTRLCHFFTSINRGDEVPAALSDFGLDNFPSLWTGEHNSDEDETPPVIAILREQ